MYKFLSGENNSIIFLDNKGARIRFNSEYEGDILCQECDQKVIGKLEDYAAKFMHEKSSINARQENIGGVEYLILENNPHYDYKKHKLFLLSLLWRSSISSRSFFKKIKLSSEHEEIIRKMIINEDPGDPSVYPCFLHLPPLTISPNGEEGFNTMHMQTMSPIAVKNDDWEMYKFVIEGMSFYFVIEKPFGTKIEPSVEQNKLLLKFSTLEEHNEIIKMSIDMIKNHKL